MTDSPRTPGTDAERRLARQIHDYSEMGIRPFDAVEIAAHALDQDGSAHPHRRNPGGSRMLSRILVIAAAVGALLAATTVVPFGGNAPAPTTSTAPASAGRILFARHYGDGTHRTFTILPDGTHEAVLVPTDTCCGVPSADGSRVLIDIPAPGGRITVSSVTWTGTDARTLTLPDATLNVGPGAWSPDGGTVALEGWDDTDPGRVGVYLASASLDAAPTQLTSTTDGHHDIPLSFSPDGTRLLVYREIAPPQDNAGIGTLRIVPLDGGAAIDLDPTDMTSACCTFGSPATWSPDGTKISFSAFKAHQTDGTSAVFVADPASGKATQVTEWGVWTTSARWSPDGTRILFDKSATPGGNHHIFVVAPDGSGLTDLQPAGDGSGKCCGIWSPTGDQVLVQGGVIGSPANHLWIGQVDGSGFRQLTDCAGAVVPAGQPCRDETGPNAEAVDGYAWAP